jgi:protein MpaA
MKTEILGNIINPSVIVIGVFHGDEPQGDWLIRKYCSDYPNTSLLMIPCLNKSGMENKTRVNSNGVDLNRNFPTRNWELTKRDEFYGGAAPASEEETCFIIDLVEKYMPKAILTLHAPFKVVNYDGDGSEIAQKISEIIDYPVEPSIGYPTPGSFGTWAGIERNIPTITLELDEEVDVQELKEPVFKSFKLLEEMYS